MLLRLYLEDGHSKGAIARKLGISRDGCDGPLIRLIGPAFLGLGVCRVASSRVYYVVRYGIHFAVRPLSSRVVFRGSSKYYGFLVLR
jgi:hypothetical protein